MLVTCASCLTKFNLDDSRIPIEGTQVRCSRCKHVFYVVPPPETRKEIIDGFQDFAKFHKGLIKEGKKEAGASEEGSSAAITGSLPEETEAVEEEIEIEEERIEEETLGEGEIGEESIGEKEEPQKIGTDERTNFDKEIEEKVDRLVVEEAKKEAEVEAFLFSEKAPAEEKKEWAPPEKREEWTPPPENKEEIPPPERTERFTREEPAREEKAEKKTRQAKSPLRVEKKGPPRFLILLFILVLLVVGIFYLWTELSPGGRLSSYVEDPIKKISGFWNQILGTEGENLIIWDIKVSGERIEDVPLFIISGKIKNQTEFTKKYVKIKVTIFDQDNLKVEEKEIVCGRIISQEELMKQPLEFFNGDMAITPETDKEKIVPPDKSVPFMVIFKDPPSGAKFKYEILEAPNL